MKFTLLILLLFLMISARLTGQVVFNEVQTSNKETFADPDGDYTDWIELFNSGSTAAYLDGYGLTDNPADPFKWRFPAVSIPAGSHLLVYASGKDRRPLVNHWETAVKAEDTWRYHVGTDAPPPDWTSLSFDDSGWPEGMGGIGYGDDDDNTIIPTAISVFMRRTFSIQDTLALQDAIFNMDYDDGFVAYLNGTEIARSNMAGNPPVYDELATASREALMYQGGSPEYFTISSEFIHSLILNGTNVLSVEAHNVDAASSDLSSIPFLSFSIRNGNTYFQPVPSWFQGTASGGLHTNFKLKHSGETLVLTTTTGSTADTFQIPYSDIGHSFCRIPDGNAAWCVSTTPSPGQTNNLSACFSGYAETPVIEQQAGYYQAGTAVTITAQNPGSVIHYTLNGNIPTLTDPVYQQAFTLDSTSVVRARCFGPGGYLPGKVQTSSFIMENRFTIPVISICTDSSNLWDYYTGIYALGPSADPGFPYFGANFWQPWEKDCHIEYFENLDNRKLNLDAGISIHGGWSRAFPQKSFTIATHSYYDSSYIHYKLFGDKPITDFNSFILRNSGNDWMVTQLRDALMQRTMRNSYADYMAYSPSAVYLNGDYWGIYNIRERNNKDYLAANHGVNADSLDIIVNDGEVAEGTADAFWQAANFIGSHELSNQEFFNQAAAEWNLQNLADYYIAETYFVNNDWIGDWTNNVKVWKERKPGGRWNYILWDMDFGLGLSSSYVENKLAVAMNPPVATPHAVIFRSFLDNPGFRGYFINRYADLINTSFQYASVQSLLLEMRDSIYSEIPFAWQRWFGYDGTDEWLANLNVLSDFVVNRQSYARQYINSTFNLGGQVNTKLSVLPAGAGVIKMNTIYPGTFPWVGTYFKGNPVTITAVPAPGFQFQYWAPNTYILTADTNRSLTIDLTHFDNFKAVFYGVSEDPRITFTEVNYHSDSTLDAGDWIELHNYGDVELDLSDWFLTDSRFYNKFTIATGTRIPEGGYLVLAEDTLLFHQRHPGIHCLGPLGFSLGNQSETLSLFDRMGDTVVSLTYSDTVKRLMTCDGLGRTLELPNTGTGLNDPSGWFAGCMEGSPGMAYQPCQEQLVISEINYNSADWADAGDWVEVMNPTNRSLDLSGFRFSDSDDTHQFILPSGTLLEGGDYLVLAGDELKFSAKFPWLTNQRGYFGFGLSGSGEALRMYDASGKLAFSMIYDDESPWPAEADGQGYTLEIADPHGKVNEGVNWFAGCLEGSPGGPYIFPCHTGVRDNPQPGLAVFPNPASSQLFIVNQGAQEGRINARIVDAMGRVVQESELDFSGQSMTRLELNSLPNGIYSILFIGPGLPKPEVEKIVVFR